MKKSSPNFDFINASNSCLTHFKKSLHILYIIAFFAMSTQTFSQETTVIFNTPGTNTFTTPCNVESITIEAWGAGGGGQRVNANKSTGGGGAGGGYIKATYSVTPNTTYTLNVGNGGSGASGNDGTASWFNSNSTILAVGGNGAGTLTSNNTSGTRALAFTTGNIGGTTLSRYGGNGGNGSSSASGGGGSSAGNDNGNNATNSTGGIAPTNGYAGANGKTSQGNGSNGNIGAGGAGANTDAGNGSNDFSGGNGGNGQIKISYSSTVSTNPTQPGTNTPNSATCKSFIAKWGISNNATSYVLDVALNSNFTIPVSGFNNLNVGNNTTRTITGLNNDTTYYYRVKGINGCGESTYSTAMSFTTASLPTQPMLVSTNQPNCISTTGNITLNNLTSGGTLIQSGTSSNSIAITGSSMTLNNLAAGTYSFSVKLGDCISSSSQNITLAPATTNTWNGTIWSNGTPTIEQEIVFNSTYSSSTDLVACACTVNDGASVIINSGNTFKIANSLTVKNTGKIFFENNASLVQINNVANSGNIIYKRTASGIKGSDYVYWSSPVADQAINSIYTAPAQGPKYSWNPILNNSNNGQGDYVNANGATMEIGKGYLVRGSSSFGMAATNINTTFTGRPNNGTIPVTVKRGSHTGAPYNGTNGTQITNLDDNYNLIGNPYPSAINALKFIDDNSTIIRGSVQLWKHGSDPAANNGTTYTNPFYGTYAYNYSASDYITINKSGTSTPGFSENIKAGQAFFVEMLDGPATSQNVVFNNAQRRDAAGTPYANNAFYRNSNQENTPSNEVERHRIWLDIKNANNNIEVALVGYIAGATMDDDSAYDAFAPSVDMGIYSLINNQSYIIQGRSLPFNDNDQVAIGFNVPAAGNYSVGINTADGLFLGSQDVYLKDELLNIYHDLKSSPYSFTAAAGVHNTRFKLVYKNTVLSTETFNENAIQIAKNSTNLDIVSGNEIMDNVKVYDLRGRLIVERNKVNNNTISIDVNGIENQVLIVTIITAEGIKITRKIL